MSCHIHASSCSWRRCSKRPPAFCFSMKRVTASQNSASPVAFSADSCSTCAAACACGPNQRSALVICARARVAAASSMSALLMTTMSASSITPFLMACRSSPALGSCISTKTSVMPATAVSLWPTPTVSTITTSCPAASHTRSASRVFSATPPSVPDAGLGRMNAPSLTESCSMRVLSPRMEPPLTLDDGSTASTATRWPRSIRNSPSTSMKVLLPTPGTPGQADAQRAAARRQQGVEQFVGARAVVGPRALEQRDGRGPARGAGAARARRAARASGPRRRRA